MKTQGWAVLLAALAIAACGGGGGGGSDPSGDDGGGNGGGGGSGDGGTGTPTSNGKADIVFPGSNATATAQTITVRGIASDPEGVATVTINGVTARIAATGSTGGRLGKAQKQTDVAWTADVELASGENELVISIADESGNVTEAVDAATITYVEVPITSTFDPEGTRLVGLSYTLTSSGYVQRLVEHNYETGEQTVFEDPIWTDPALSCFRRFENEFLYLSFFTGTWELRKVDLATGQDSLLVQITDADLFAGDGFTTQPFVAELACDSEHDSAYVLANYTDANGMGYRDISAFAKSRILEIDLATDLVTITTLSESNTALNPRWIAQHMALADTTIVTVEDISPLAALTSVSLADGQRTFLTPGLAVGGVALDTVLDAGRVYVATLDGVDEVDVTLPGKRNISEVDDSHPLVFSQVRSINFDGANNRVIVGDEALDALIAVDIGTGTRTEFLSRKVGSGTAIITPRQFVLSADGARAYVLDDGDNAPERLFEIDFATGDRRVIGDVAQEFNSFGTGLALDEAAGRAFVSFEHAILQVDLETEDVQVIANVDSTVLKTVNGLLLDAENGRLLVGDFVSDAIFALDLETHAIEVVSQAGGRGDGPTFGGIVSMSRGALDSELYVAGQTSESITRVDLETGDREAFEGICNAGLSPPFAGLQQVLYNGALNELIISADELFSFDLGASTCNTLPRRVFWLQLGITPTNQMFAAAFGGLLQLDRETGEVVIISK